MELQSEVNRLKLKLMQAEDDLEAEEKNVTDLGEQLSQLGEQLENVKGQLQKATEHANTIDVLHAELLSVSESNKQHDTQEQEHERRLETMMVDLEAKQRRIQELEKESGSVKKNSRKFDSLTIEIQNLQKSVAESQGRLKKLHSTHHAKIVECDEKDRLVQRQTLNIREIAKASMKKDDVIRKINRTRKIKVPTHRIEDHIGWTDDESDRSDETLVEPVRKKWRIKTADDEFDIVKAELKQLKKGADSKIGDLESQKELLEYQLGRKEKLLKSTEENLTALVQEVSELVPRVATLENTSFEFEKELQETKLQLNIRSEEVTTEKVVEAGAAIEEDSTMMAVNAILAKQEEVVEEKIDVPEFPQKLGRLKDGRSSFCWSAFMIICAFFMVLAAAISGCLYFPNQAIALQQQHLPSLSNYSFLGFLEHSVPNFDDQEVVEIQQSPPISDPLPSSSEEAVALGTTPAIQEKAAEIEEPEAMEAPPSEVWAFRMVKEHPRAAIIAETSFVVAALGVVSAFLLGFL